MTVDIEVLKEGENPSNPNRPFTIAFAANPVLEQTSGQFVVDSITQNRSEYDDCRNYAINSLFGQHSGQREQLLAPADIARSVRIVSVFESGLPNTSVNSLILEMYDRLATQRLNIRPFLARHSIEADIAIVITRSDSSNVSTAYDTTDDPSKGGVNFTLDSNNLMHTYYCMEPGSVALHSSERDITPLHEFQHAMGSYSNGQVEDLYHGSGGRGLNKKRHRPGSPKPANFAVLQGIQHYTDGSRNHIGYPPNWNTYHCELNNPAAPAVMDNYYKTRNPLDCENDSITRNFLQDRIRVKMGRP